MSNDYGFIKWLQTGGKAYTKRTAESYETTCRIFLQGERFVYPYVGGYFSFIEQLKVETLDQRIEESNLNKQDKSRKQTTRRIFSYYAEYIRSKDKEYKDYLERVKADLEEYVNQQQVEDEGLSLFLTSIEKDLEKHIQVMPWKTFLETLDDFIEKKWIEYGRTREDFYKVVNIRKQTYRRWWNEKNPSDRFGNKNLYRIAFVLKLTSGETKELIESAGRNFDSPREKFDRTCKRLIELKIYDPEDLNRYLAKYCGEVMFTHQYNDIKGKVEPIQFT